MTDRVYQRWLVSGLLVALATIGARPAAAQRGPRDPHLAYSFPAGCQQGRSCEVVLGGQYLKDVSQAHLSGEGVEVEVVKWYRPLTQGEFNNLRMALEDARTRLKEERVAAGRRGSPSQEEIATASGLTEEQLREMEIYRERERDPKRQPNEQLLEEITLKLTVARDAAPGKRELRVLTETSMSNPIWIQVGRWPEVRETEPNDVEPDPVIDQLPIVVNGQAMPGDKDKFSFFAARGTRLVISAAAREVIPYLADAVPGWFQAVISLSDSAGHEVSYADSFHYRQDPLIYFEVPRDDHYTVSIHDSLYRGREDFVYRITIGELPYVTSIFPLGAQTDSEVAVELQGWNLSRDSLNVQTQSRRSYRPVRWFSVPQGDDLEVSFPLQIDRLPEVFDQEPNNTTAESQDATTRMIINGRIDHPGDEDVFRIEGGGTLVAEVNARRYGSPLDSVLTVTDADGNELAFNDDYEDKSQALLTHHADSHLRTVLPGGGTYFLRLTDVQSNGGKDFIYRLYLRAPEPDYELRVVPSSIIARAGATVPITVFALRKDDFDGEIELSLIEPPPGFQLTGGMIPANADLGRMTLTLPADTSESHFELEMEGTSRSRTGLHRSLTRPAVPAENMMQAFIWYHLVPVEEWHVIVSGKAGARPPFEVVMADSRIKLSSDGELLLPLRARGRSDITPDELLVELYEPPPGVSAALVRNPAGRVDLQLTTDGELAEAGWQGNLLLRVYRETTPEPTEANPAPQPRRTDHGYLPAIPVEIAPRRSRR